MDRKESVSPPPPPVENFDRQSSFHMAFLQAGAHHAALAFTGDNSSTNVVAAPSSGSGFSSSQNHHNRTPAAAQSSNVAGAGVESMGMPAMPPRPAGISRRTSSTMTRAFLQENRRRMSQQIQQQQQQQQQQTASAASTTTSDTTSEAIPAMPTPIGSRTRQPSWFYDAINQGGGMSEENIRAMLGVVESDDDDDDEDGQNNAAARTSSSEIMDQKPAARPSMSGGTTTPPATVLLEGHSQSEVMEQYRIMAHVEAGKLFKKLSPAGLGVEEYIAQKQPAQESAAAAAEPLIEEHIKQQRVQVQQPPPLRKVPASCFDSLEARRSRTSSITRTNSNSGAISMPSLPPLSSVVVPTAATLSTGSSRTNVASSGSSHNLTSSTNSDQNTQQLQKGKVLFREMVKMAGEKGRLPIVRCFHCNTHLQVDPSATLVACPSCSTISPNTSTRR